MAQDLLKSNEPNDEKEPVAHDKFPLPFETCPILQLLGYISYRFSVRPVLLQITKKNLV